MTSIGDYAFDSCQNLISITIPNNVKSIGKSAFYKCSSLSSIYIPDEVTSIEGYTFYGCSSLTSVNIPNNLTYIGTSAFSNCTCLEKINLNKKTDLLILLWKENSTKDKCYDVATGEKLTAPFLNNINTTMTTASFNISNYYSDFSYDINGYSYEITDEVYVKLEYLKPNTNYQIRLLVKSDNGNVYETSPLSFTTKEMRMELTDKKTTASSIDVVVSHTSYKEDVIMSEILTFDGKINEGNRINVCGLQPNKAYIIALTLIFEGDITATSTQTISTDALTLVTEQPKVASVGNVIVSAKANLDDNETNVGFEWRRTDWTDEFASNSGNAYIYDGRMEGYIRNLYAEKLWKYRPYYETNTGIRYYGDWVGMDPTNTSYFEPTVHTYSDIILGQSTANVKGYVMRGSDNIT